MDLQGRLQQDVNRVKGLQEEERVHSVKIQNGPSHGGKSAKGSGEKGQAVDAYIVLSGVEDTKVLMASYEDNTS